MNLTSEELTLNPYLAVAIKISVAKVFGATLGRKQQTRNLLTQSQVVTDLEDRNLLSAMQNARSVHGKMKIRGKES